MVKVLIVEDSALMRRTLTEIFSGEGFIVSSARNGLEGLQAVTTFDPDVVTLDINMPEMDGLTFLSRLMVERPKPVVMVSSLTEKGALATFEALALGAVDFVHKPDGTVSHRLDRVRTEIVDKVRAAARARLRRSVGLRERVRQETVSSMPSRRSAATAPPGAVKAAASEAFPVVLIGVSTGGPSTVEEILRGLPEDFPAPIVVAQHMPANFTSVFARRLNDVCPLRVVEVSQPMLLEPGVVYIGRGDADVVFTRQGNGLVAAAVPAAPDVLWHPSVDRMVESAMRVAAPNRLIGVLLTGMGNDGARRMAELRAAGGRTIAESDATAVVFGMPQELIKLGGAEVTLPSGRVAPQLVAWLSTAHRR